jgi:RNase P protein component
MDGLLPRLTPGWDIILLARKPIVSAKFDSIQAAVSELFNRAGLLITQDGVHGTSK